MSEPFPLPLGLFAQCELVLRADDRVWQAAVRQAVADLPADRRPLVVDNNSASPSLVVVELPNTPPIDTLRFIADRRPRIADDLLIVLASRAEVPLRWTDWRPLLLEAGADAAIERPSDGEYLRSVLLRAADAMVARRACASPHPPRLPAGWQPTA